MKRNITDNPLPFLKTDFVKPVADIDTLVEPGAYLTSNTIKIQIGGSGAEVPVQPSWPIEVIGHSNMITQMVFDPATGSIYIRQCRVRNGVLTPTSWSQNT